ncbi:MAG: pitrilysin family protein, partial [Pseudoxanthomonas sp.]
MQTLRPILAFALASMLGLSAPAHSRDTAPSRNIVAGPSIEGISEYRLANGLRVLLFPDATKPTVTVNVVYGVGSVNENYGETGMAHLLEHMQFKGTPTHGDISGEMKKRGIEFNASTSLDRTDYFASFPASDETLTWVLDLEADRMVNSRVARKDLDSEMTVVRNELESRENNPGGVLFERIRSTAFLWHNYGKSTIGARSDVEGVPIERLQAFYRQWYQPDTATLIVAGRIDPEKTLQLVAERFGRIAKPTRTLPRYYTVEPTQDGEREVTVRRVGDLNLTAVAYHIPAVTHADNAALSVLGDLLGHTPGGRLHKALVESKLAAGAGAFAESMRDPGLLGAYVVVPKDGDSAKAQAELLKQVEKLAERPVTQAEVDESRQRIANSFDLYFTDVNAVGMGLSEYLAAGDWRLLFTTRDAIDKVTAADVNRVAAAYLKSSNRTLGRFVPTDKPDRAEIPAAPEAARVVENYKGRAVVAAGENFDPSPQNLQARTQIFTLGDGLSVALLPKKTRGETVVVNANFRFGDVASVTGRQDAAGMAGAMLMRGSKTMTRQQIDQRFEALKTQANVGGSLQGASINLHTRRAQLADALGLAADVLRNPTFPDSEFEQLRLQAITGLEASRKEPANIASLALSRHFDPWPAGHPLHVRTLDESLAATKALKLEDLAAFHRDFYGTAEGEIAIVGDFDPAAVRKQLETLFAGWKSPKPFAPIDTQYTDVPARRERFETPDKANAGLMARQNLPLKVIDADYPALVVANRIFGGGALKSRLGDRIRQKEGLSYGVASGIRADDSRDGKDNAGHLSLHAIAAPQNMDK